MRLPTEACLAWAAAAALCCGCRPTTSEATPATICVSGDTHGWITPCGCASNQSGGLPRRATLVAQAAARQATVVLDAGGASAEDTPYDRVRFEAILRGELLMGLQAHNLGAGEAALGAPYLREVAARLQAPLISANLSDEAGAAIVPAARIVAVGGRRLAIVGVLSESFAPPGLRVDPPLAAARRALAERRGQYDAAIVLAYLSESELRAFAAALPEADAVVGGPTGQPIPPTRIGPTLLTSATNKGKFVAQLQWSLGDKDGAGDGGCAFSGAVVELNESFLDAVPQLANVQAYRALLAERDFAAGDTIAGRQEAARCEGLRIAGSDRCAGCHEAEDLAWQASAHARAWQSLLAKGAQVDPDCQRCHTTGYGAPGGFISAGRSAERRGVGCESCHGPSQAHVEDPAQPTGWVDAAEGRCIVCHDRENSPHFDFPAYWKQIEHGRSSDRPPGET